MMWNGGNLYSPSGSPLFSDPISGVSPFSNRIYSPHEQLNSGLESPLQRSANTQGSGMISQQQQQQREDFRAPGSRTQMRNVPQTGSLFPPVYPHGMMIPGSMNSRSPTGIISPPSPHVEYTQGNIPVSPTMSHHQRSVSVDSYMPEGDLFGSHGAHLGEFGQNTIQRHKRNPSSNAVDSLHDNGMKVSSGCRYYANGYCSRGDRCNYEHILPMSGGGNSQFDHLDKRGGAGSVGGGVGMVGGTNSVNLIGGGGVGPNTALNSQIRSSRRSARVPVVQPVVVPSDLDKNMECRYQSLDQVIGQVYSMCKDQHGCRFLQKKLEEKDNNFEAVNIIFDEVYDHMVELMTDPFGNYLCQKLIEHCNEQQQLIIVQKVAPKLVEISKNMHGTRAVQKMIECLCTPPQVQLVVNALKSSVVELIQDLNGNHVIQRCLNRLSSQDKQFIYDAVAEHAVEVSTHRHGCCVMQRCIDSASDAQKVRKFFFFLFYIFYLIIFFCTM